MLWYKRNSEQKCAIKIVRLEVCVYNCTILVEVEMFFLRRDGSGAIMIVKNCAIILCAY